MVDTVSIIEVNTHAKHSTQILHLGLLALAALSLAGCWEEVHYTPPPGGEPTTARARRALIDETPPPVADDPSSDFANDLAATLEPPVTTSSAPAGEPASAGGDAARYSTTDTPPSAPETESDPLFDDAPTTEVEPPRYAESAPTTETAQPESPRYEPSTDSTPPVAAETLSRHAEALPPTNESPPAVSASAPPLPAAPNSSDPARNTRRVAWLLGTKLSLAVLAHDRAGDPAEIKKWYDQSQSLARLLGTTIDPLPTPNPGSAAGNQGIDFVFKQGQRIGRELAKRYGDAEAALFELAVKTNVLLTLYHPNAAVIQALTESMEAAGKRANLPADVVAPLAKAVAEKAPYATVRAAVYQMNRDIDRQLSAAQP